MYSRTFRNYKGSIKELRKINDVRKQKEVIFPYDLLGSCGNKLTVCGREINKIICARHLLARY